MANSRTPESPRSAGDHSVAVTRDRVRELEARLARLYKSPPAATGKPDLSLSLPGQSSKSSALPLPDAQSEAVQRRLGSQRRETERLRNTIEAAETSIGRLSATDADLAGDLLAFLDTEIRHSVSAAEVRFQGMMSDGCRQIVQGWVQNVEKGVAGRISSMEEEIAEQASLMADLRESSARTAEGMERLLVAVDRLAARTPRFARAESACPPGAAEGPPAAGDERS